MIPIVTIEGPTASGKSRFAIELAQALDTEIISADSRQVYRFLDIGTAKPSKAELSSITHHLISVIDPNQSFNAGLFRKSALEICKRVYEAGKIPIVCGGTGLYIKALLEGLFDIPDTDADIRRQLKNALESEGLDVLYDELKRVDPDAALNISSNDAHRILRGLEVFKSSGKPISVHWTEQTKHNIFQPFRIIMDSERQTLYENINERILEMLQCGLLQEINSVREMGYDWSAAGFNSVGYKEYKPYLENEASLESCIDKAQQHTRNYAKRQFTWYKKCIFHLTMPSPEISINSVRDKIKLLTGV